MRPCWSYTLAVLVAATAARQERRKVRRGRKGDEVWSSFVVPFSRQARMVAGEAGGDFCRIPGLTDAGWLGCFHKLRPWTCMTPVSSPDSHRICVSSPSRGKFDSKNHARAMRVVGGIELWRPLQAEVVSPRGWSLLSAASSDTRFAET
jgi:hypothetical protein